MPVGRDGDQLVPGAAPEVQYAPALPTGVGPVEVDCGPVAREHQVVQPRVRVERFTHQAPPRSGGGWEALVSIIREDLPGSRKSTFSALPERKELATSRWLTTPWHAG